MLRKASRPSAPLAGRWGLFLWHPDCSTPGKHPLTEHGKDDATRNPDIIKVWWGRWPKANIGLRMTPSRLPRYRSPQRWGRVTARLGGRDRALPDTVTQLTGGGGGASYLSKCQPIPSRKGYGLAWTLSAKLHCGHAFPSRLGPTLPVGDRHAPGQIALAPLPPLLIALAQKAKALLLPAEIIPKANETKH